MISFTITTPMVFITNRPGAMPLLSNHHKLAYKAAIKWDDPYYLADETLEIGNDYLKLAADSIAPNSIFKNPLRFQLVTSINPKCCLALISLSDLEEAKGNFEKAYQLQKETSEFC